MPNGPDENDRSSAADLRKAQKDAKKKRAAQKEQRLRRTRRKAEQGPKEQPPGSKRYVAVVLVLVLVCVLVVSLILVPPACKRGQQAEVDLWVPTFTLPPPASVSQPEPDLSEAQPGEDSSQPQEPPAGPSFTFTEEETATLNAMLDEWAAKETFIRKEEEAAEEGEGDGADADSSTPATAADAPAEYVADGGHQVSVWFYDLGSGAQYAYNADERVGYASLMKAPYAMYLFALAEQEVCTLADSFTVEPAHVEKSKENSGIIKDMEVPRSFTLREMIYYMLRYSDTAALRVLLERFPYDGFAEWAAELGLTDMGKVISGSDSAREMGLWTAYLYEYMESGKYGAELKADLMNTNYSMISTQNPKASKYGWDKSAYHEMVVVYGEHPYLLVIMTDKWGGSAEDRQMFRELPGVLEEMMAAKYAAEG